MLYLVVDFSHMVMVGGLVSFRNALHLGVRFPQSLESVPEGTLCFFQC